MLRSSTIIIYLLLSALTVTNQLFDFGKTKSADSKKWFEDGSGRFQWSFGCSFPKGGLNAVDVKKIKKNQSSTCPSLCYEDNHCTHFIYSKGYCFLKKFKFVDASPKAAIYNNPGGLCGFVVERPNVVKEWNVGHNGRTRWSIDCDYPNAKFNNYIASKLMLDFSKCEDHCLSIKDCTHFAVWMKTCWVKNMREASIVQIVDRGVQICGFVPERQRAAITQKTRTVSPKANTTNMNNYRMTTPISFVSSTVNRQQTNQVMNSTFAPPKTSANTGATSKIMARRT